jgi:ADP-heptose:LPS heptosyltransferase
MVAPWRLSRALRQKRFDVAVVLHPTVRVHLLCFLAGIRERIGYDRKAPYFLTRIIPHKKQEGRKHELEYNFDLLRPLGIETVEREMFMPVRPDAQRFVAQRLKEAGVDGRRALVAVNPAASDPSRRWPVEKFAELIDRLGQAGDVGILVVAHSANRDLTRKLLSLIHVSAVDLTGAFDLVQLASLFKRCRLFISNDSGPVHLAVAVSTPVIALFGRNQAGLSPERWRPLGHGTSPSTRRRTARRAWRTRATGASGVLRRSASTRSSGTPQTYLKNNTRQPVSGLSAGTKKEGA